MRVKDATVVLCENVTSPSKTLIKKLYKIPCLAPLPFIKVSE